MSYHLTAYTDGAAPNATSLGAGAVLRSSHFPRWSRTIATTLDASNWGIFEAELFAISAALDAVVESTSDIRWRRVDIFSDSQHALRRLQTPWNHDWTTGQHLHQRILASAQQLVASSGTQIHLWWIPGHSETDGNDEADRVAKAAAQLEVPNTSTSTSWFQARDTLTTGFAEFRLATSPLMRARA